MYLVCSAGTNRRFAIPVVLSTYGPYHTRYHTDTSVLVTVGSNRFNGTASSLEISGYEHPLTQRHNPDKRNSQLHRCENLKIRVSDNHLFAYGYSSTDTQISTVKVQRNTRQRPP